MTENKLTRVPAGPRCPSGPFIDSRERTRSHRGSSVTCTKINRERGQRAYRCTYTVRWLIRCSQKHLRIARMRQTHSQAWGSGSPCFAFLTFAAVLSWVPVVALEIAVTQVVLAVLLSANHDTVVFNLVCLQ